MAISVNMLGLRNLIDAQPRWKNGQPHQRTMGVASANSIQLPRRGVRACAAGSSDISSAMMRGIMRTMAKAMSGMPMMTLVQKRRVMSRSSGFSSVATVTVLGSSAMPQMGHEPGASRTISGCMGQVHCVLVAMGSSGSSAMPHFGHAPG